MADGDSEAASVALLAVLQGLMVHERLESVYDPAAVARHGPGPVLNTRGTAVGMVRAAGALRFHA